MTKTQQSILAIVQQTDGHLTAEQVLGQAKQLHPSVSLSTVYRNLNLFADAGKIRRIQRATSADFYEKNLAPHDHACCVNCGGIADFTVPDLKGYLVQHFEYPILSFELLINYVCPQCAAKPPKTHPPGKEKRHAGGQKKADQ